MHAVSFAGFPPNAAWLCAPNQLWVRHAIMAADAILLSGNGLAATAFSRFAPPCVSRFVAQPSDEWFPASTSVRQTVNCCDSASCCEDTDASSSSSSCERCRTSHDQFHDSPMDGLRLGFTSLRGQIGNLGYLHAFADVARDNSRTFAQQRQRRYLSHDSVFSDRQAFNEAYAVPYGSHIAHGHEFSFFSSHEGSRPLVRHRDAFINGFRGVTGGERRLSYASRGYQSAAAMAVVDEARAEAMNEERWRTVEEKTVLSCTTFNVLAPIYKRMGVESERESACQHVWRERNQEIIKTLLDTKSSILCLQECWLANSEWVDMYDTALQGAGYQLLKLPRTNARGDGLMMAVRASEWEVVDHHPLCFNDCGDRVAQIVRLRARRGGRGEGNRSMKLGEVEEGRWGTGEGRGEEGEGGEEVVVANTHLLFPHNANSSIVRLCQVYKLLERIDGYREEHHAGALPVILCGDLNGTKQGNVYKLLRAHGFVSSFDSAHHHSDDDEQWVSHRNHHGNLCGVDYVWVLNPEQHHRTLAVNWRTAVFGLIRSKLASAGITNVEAAFDFFLRAGEGHKAMGPLAHGGRIFPEGGAAGDQAAAAFNMGDFQRGLDRLGLTGVDSIGLTRIEVEELMRSADCQGKGCVDFEDFKALFDQPTWDDTVAALRHSLATSCSADSPPPPAESTAAGAADVHSTTSDISSASTDITITSPDISITSPDISITSPDISMTSADISITSPDISITSADISSPGPLSSMCNLSTTSNQQTQHTQCVSTAIPSHPSSPSLQFLPSSQPSRPFSPSSHLSPFPSSSPLCTSPISLLSRSPLLHSLPHTRTHSLPVMTCSSSSSTLTSSSTPISSSPPPAQSHHFFHSFEPSMQFPHLHLFSHLPLFRSGISDPITASADPLAFSHAVAASARRQSFQQQQEQQQHHQSQQQQQQQQQEERQIEAECKRLRRKMGLSGCTALRGDCKGCSFSKAVALQIHSMGEGGKTEGRVGGTTEGRVKEQLGRGTMQGSSGREGGSMQLQGALNLDVLQATLFPRAMEDGVWPEDYTISDHAVLTVRFGRS